MDATGIIKSFFKGNAQTVLLKKNIVCSLVLQGISILISFQVVPLTINFVNPTQYGIWIALSSLMSWFFFFDIGLTHGFRNRFAEAKARGDIDYARTLVSTTYTCLFLIIASLLIVILPVSTFIDWSDVLKIDSSYREELTKVFMILVSFFGINMVLQVFYSLATADQRPALSSFIQVTGQASAFVVILIMTLTVDSGNLTQLALAFSGMPVVVLLASSAILFSKRYRIYRPSRRYIDFKCVKSIFGIGGKFFIITTSMLFIFQLMNVIISREQGPEAVTQYNISFKYFNILYMVATLILNPFWSTFTDAYTRKDFNWMESMLSKLEKLWLLAIPCLLIMFACADLFFRLWIKDAVTVPVEFNIAIAIYTLTIILANLYMMLINGTGKVFVQLIIYLVFAAIAYPVMTFMCSAYGIPGLLALPISVYLIQAFFGRIQVKKLISGNADGIWIK